MLAPVYVPSLYLAVVAVEVGAGVLLASAESDVDPAAVSPVPEPPPGVGTGRAVARGATPVLEGAPVSSTIAWSPVAPLAAPTDAAPGVLNENSRTSPATVMSEAQAAFRGTMPPWSSVIEPLLVDPLGRDTQSFHDRLGAGHHPGRAAQVDLARGDVRDHRRDGLRAERIRGERLSRTDEIPDDDRPALGDRLDLAAEDEIGRRAGAIQQRDPRGRRHGFEDRPERRDADPSGDEEDVPRGPAIGGEVAIGPFDDDPRPDLEAVEARRVVTQGLDREAHPPAVRLRRDRVRMGAPPAGGQEPNDEVLACPDLEPIEVLTRQVDRDDARRLLDDVRDAEPMSDVDEDGRTEPEGQQGPDHRDVQGDPIPPCERVVDEVGTDDELVGESEGDRQVGVEMDPVPGLIGDAPASEPHRGDRDGDEEPEAHDGHEDEVPGR